MALKVPRYSTSNYTIRPSRSHEETNQIWYPFMLELGWDRGPSDLATYVDHSRSRGMILAFPRDSSKPIGHVAGIVNDNLTGWVGLFIVDKRYQGAGLGAALWADMMKDFQECGTEYVGLDAVPQQKQTYERRGFVESKAGHIKVMARPFNTALEQRSKAFSDKIVDISTVSAHVLAQYEQKYTGFYRPKLWDNLLGRSDVVGFLASRQEVLTASEGIRACALIRRCPGGARLGPVYAADIEAAEAVLSRAIRACTAEYVQSQPMSGIDMSDLSTDEILQKAHIAAEVWSGNPEAGMLFEKLGWSELGRYHRMWLNDKATPAQSPGGAAQTGLFATFDAAVG